MVTDKQKKIIKAGALALLLLLLAGSMLQIVNLKAELSAQSSINNALSNDVVKYRDKSGAEVAEKKLILSSYKALKAVHASDSSEIGRLQKLVNKNTLSATIIKNTTHGHNSGGTEIVFVPVTNGNNGDSLTNVTPCDTVYPEYRYQDSTKWAVFKISANRDSTHLDYKFFNEYEISQEIKKTGIWPFRKSEPIVKVRNLNPYTETNQISSFALQSPKNGKKTAIIAGTAAAFAFIAGILIAK